MSVRTTAARYAKALLEVGIQESDPAKIEQGLASFVNAMTHAELSSVLTSPGVPATVRRNVVEAVATSIGAEPPLAKILTLLAERGRMEMLPVLLDVYREQLLAHRNIVRASVTSAAPLAEDKVQAVQNSLEHVTGKQVQLEVAVDPALIGGLVARIGSTVYDGSVRTQLARMKEKLLQEA